MSATVAAALKKIAVALLTDKKALKVSGSIVLGVVVIVIMPIVAVVSIFNGTMGFDTDRFEEMVMQNMAAEDTAVLQTVEDTMLAIEDEMTAAGFADRERETQVLYVLALSDAAHEPEFVSRLVGCFVEDQTDEQLIAAVNETFVTTVEAADFAHAMESVRADAKKEAEPS